MVIPVSSVSKVKSSTESTSATVQRTSHNNMTLKTLSAVLPALLFAGCASQAPVRVPPSMPTQTQRVPPAPAPVQTIPNTQPQPTSQVVTPPPVVVVKQAPRVVRRAPPKRVVVKPQPTFYSSFEDWKADFTQRAVAQGYPSYDIQNLMQTASLKPNVIELDSRQPEFSKMPWEYADSAVSNGRINRGQNKLAENRSLFNQLEAQYGVDAEILAAIWGMESAYGSGTGSTHLPSALGSLAYDGRRRDFAEEQLIALTQLLERGDVSWSQLKGSWAGGMGHTQFIPATWLVQGVDGDNDGRRNPWSTADALASTANYLSNAGWVRGLAPFYEVRLPANFDYRNLTGKLTPADWRARGVMTIDGAYLNAGTPFELWLPAGKDGPALLLSPNFDVIKVYNNSSSYALGVSLLARALADMPGLQASWPRHEQPLSHMQATNLQQRLTQAGYDTQGIDGVIGSNTKRAFAQWQADNGQVADGFISQRSASSLIW